MTMQVDPRSNSTPHVWELGQNVVMAASAGTGKTYNLVGVLLYTMLIGCREGKAIEPARILATTFSKRAAEEILDRVRGELEVLASGAGTSRYGSLFTDRTCRLRAKEAVQRLHQLRVTTLHAFAVDLLRVHGMHVGILPDFVLLDAQAELQRLESIASDTIEHFARTRSEDLLTAVAGAGGMGELMTFIATSLREGPERGRTTAKVVIDDEAAAIEALLERVIDAARDLASSSERLGPAAKELVHTWKHAKNDDRAVERALTDLFSVRIVSKNAPSEAAWADLVDKLPGETKAVKAHVLHQTYVRRHEFRAAGETLLSLATHAEAAIASLARERQELSFSDVLVFATALLRDHPEVAREVGAEFDACLLDEAQDTSPIQRDLVLLLWRNYDEHPRADAETRPAIARIRERGLFVVGDRKQSIYGFRGADVAIFAEFAVGIAGEVARRALGMPAGLVWEPSRPTGRFFTLRENYRGTPALLDAANALSAGIFVPSEPTEVFDVHYVPSEDDLVSPSGRAPEDTVSSVSWLGLRAPAPEESDAVRELHASLVGPRRDAEIIARKIARLSEHVPLRDMAVLARSNGMLDHVAFALAQANIPYVASGRAFFSASEVRDAAAFLSLLWDPASVLSAAHVLRGPYTGLSDISLLELRGPKGGLPPILDMDGARISDADERARFTETQACIRRLVVLAERIAPADLLREGLQSLRVEAVLHRLRNGDQRVSNVRKFEQWLRKFRHLHTAIISVVFARTMPEAEAPTFSDADDAVRLLTIHASKGLSFPIVLLPELGKRNAPFAPGPAIFTDDGRLGVRLRGNRGRWLESPGTRAALKRETLKRRADAQRVWYVAITRAEREMYFAGGDDKTPSGGSMLELLPWLVDAKRAVREDLPALPLSPQEAAGSAAPTPAATQKIPAPRRLALAPTALADFVYCPRRFALANVWRVPEGRPFFARDEAAVDPRTKGTAMHRVLEHIDASAFGQGEELARKAATTTFDALFAATSPMAQEDVREASVSRVTAFLTTEYAKRLADNGGEILREVPFHLAAKGLGMEASLRGTIDMLARFPDGSVDVIDYKSGSGPSLEPYVVQLRVYARAASMMFPEAREVRAFAAFLGGTAEPVLLEAPPFNDDEWLSAVSRLTNAQKQGTFPRVELSRCRSLRCGYVPRCHGEGA